MSESSQLKVDLAKAFVAVINHGAYPLRMLDNPAIQDLLVHFGVITSADGDAFSSRRTITRQLDTFRDNIALHATQIQIF